MTFASVKNNQASTKFFLVRLKPARYMNDLLALDSGGIYQATLANINNVCEVKINGTTATEVTTVTNANEWSFNETTKVFRVRATPSSTNAIVIYFYLFYTGERARVTYEDPEDSATALRDWEPRIKKYPRLKSDIQNVLAGIFSIAKSNIELINNEYDLNVYLTANDSFYNKEIKIWTCLDDLSTIEAAFIGKITSVRYKQGSLSLDFEDNFASLEQPALMGDEAKYCYYGLEDWANVDPNKIGTPIPFIFGKVSRYQTVKTTVTNLTTAQRIDETKLYEAVCTNFTTTISTSNNRTWGLCRTRDGLASNAHTITTVDNSDANFTRLTSPAADVAKVFIGDTGYITNTGTEYSVRVWYVDRNNNYIYVTKQAAVANGDPYSDGGYVQSIVIVQGTSVYYPIAKRDYTTATTTTAGGNKFFELTFVNNFEATLGCSTLDPSQHQVYYRIHPATTNAKQGAVLKYLLTKAGLTCDSASFTSADTDLNVNVNFSIPQFDENDFANYYKYVELILESALSYLTLGNDFEVEYYVMSTPSSTTTITDIDILQASFSAEINYKDITNKLIAYNPHHSSVEASASTNDTFSSYKARYLHDVDKTSRFRHVLEDITSRGQDIFDVRSERLLKYIFSSKIVNIDSILGDEFLLSTTGLAGTDTSKSVLILSLDKGLDSQNVIATDLYNL